MTKQELNRDIKRLYRKIEGLIFNPDSTEYYKFIDEGEARKEFLRLYKADEKFNYMNKNSVVIMYDLNRRYRFVPLHIFGINATLNF